MISATNLSKRYGRLTALRDVSFELDLGGTLLVTGPNGSGKTTLLRLIAGLARPTSGNVTIEGHNPRSLKARMGFVGHDPYLYPFLTAHENLRFFAQLYGAGARSVTDLMSRLNVASKRDELVRNLSRGETQKVSLARALVHDPDFVLADEPLAGLDADTAAIVPGLLQRDGRTLVIATHDDDFAARLGGSNLRLQNGRTQP